MGSQTTKQERESAGEDNPSSKDSWEGTSVGAIYDRVQPLISNLKELISEIQVGRKVVEEDEKIRSNLKDVLRALSVVDMVSDQKLIGVAGPQGSGKTTTVKWLYGIPDGYLPIGAVTGERLPVMLVEQSSESFDAFAHRYRPEEGEIERTSVSKENCKETAKSPTENDIAVELRVPSRFFNAENRGFLLLPGVQRKSDMHIRLARRVLPSAATAMVCVNDGLLAGGSVDDEIKSIRDGMTVGDTKLVYGLTKPRGGEKTEDAIQTLCKRFGVDKERVFVVDAPGPAGEGEESMPDWSEDFRHAIDQYGRIPHEQRRAQLDTLREVISDLTSNLEDLSKGLNKSEIMESRTERTQVRPIIDAFNERAESQRRRLDENIEEALNYYRGPAISEIRDKIQEESLWKKIKRLAKTGSLERQTDFQRMIRRAWKNARPAGPAGAIADGLNATVQDTLPTAQNIPRIKKGKKGGHVSSPTDLLTPAKMEKTSSGQNAVLLDNDTVEDIKYLIGQSDGADPSNQLRESVQAIPAVALECARLGLAVEIESPSSGEFPMRDRPVSEKEYREAANSLAKNWEETRKSGKGILKGVAAMLGADYAPDAELDVLRDIAATMGGEGSMAALGPAVVALAAGYGIATVVKTLRQEDMRRDGIAREVFNRVSNRTRIEILQKYDRYIEDVREELERKIRERYNLGANFRDLESIRTKMGSTKKSVRELKRSLPQQF